MVLGRDPFSAPVVQKTPTAGSAHKAKRSTKKVKKQETKKPTGAKRKAAKQTSRRAAKGAKSSPKGQTAKAAAKRPAARMKKQPAMPDTSHARSVAAEIDRQSLLDHDGQPKGGMFKLFQAVTHYLRPSTYGARLGEMGMNFHSQEVGPFGFDPLFWKSVEPFFRFLFETYWRIEISGLENIPTDGRALLVANHSGSLPYDGIMLRMAIEDRSPSKRAVRFLVEDFIFHFPFLGSFVNRVGGVRACQDNANRLLEAGKLVGVFPEGVKGIGKLYKDRYRLQRFGRGGFVKLAMRSDSPIIPVAVVGGEEIHPMFSRLSWLAKNLGLPYLPVTPTFPWLGPLGALPLPSKWLIRFGQPIHFGKLDPKEGAAPERLMDKVEKVRGTIQQMIDEMLDERRHPFFGR